MAAKQHIPEAKKPQEIGEQSLNDLVYSLETKTFLSFQRELVSNHLIGDMTIKDPLPAFTFDAIAVEIKKRLASFDKETLENTKVWLRDPLRKLKTLTEETKTTVEKHIHMSRKEIESSKKVWEEGPGYMKQFEDLIDAIEVVQGKTKPVEKIQKTSHKQFEQLQLFDTDHGND